MDRASRSSTYSPFIWAIIIVLLASIPYAVGTTTVSEAEKFIGYTFNIDDACVYISWMKQIADGNLLVQNRFTTVPQQVGQFNLLFVVLGAIVRLTHLSCTAVYHLARIVLGVALLMAIRRFSLRFLKEPLERLLIVPVVGLSAGLGWILSSIEGHKGPVDLWQPEAITFLSIYLNPLFLAGMTLMVASFHYFLRMMDTGSWKDTALAGLMLLLLGNIHTYDIVAVWAVWSVFVLVKMVAERRIAWRLIVQSCVAAAMMLPAIFYQLYLYNQESVFRERIGTAAPSPALWAYVAGYGLTLALAAAGVWLSKKANRKVALLALWAAIGFALPYIPVAQQRKLVMGLHIPIAILATVALADIARRLGKKSAVAVAVLLVILLSASNVVFMSRDVSRLTARTTAPMYPTYLAESEIGALEWLQKNTESDDAVLTSRELAIFVPAISGNCVYYGHWSETPDFDTKYREWLAFADGSRDTEWQNRWQRMGLSDPLQSPDNWRRELLAKSNVKYILYLAHPSKETWVVRDGIKIPAFDLRIADYVELAFEQGDTAIYKVKKDSLKVTEDPFL